MFTVTCFMNAPLFVISQAEPHCNEVWCSTKPSGKKVAPTDSKRSTGPKVHPDSIMSGILTGLGVALNEKGFIPLAIKPAAAAKQPDLPNQLEHWRFNTAPQFLLEALEHWWRRHSQIFIDALGYECAAHVHAAAATAAVAIHAAPCHIKDPVHDMSVLAFHLLALKFVCAHVPEADAEVSNLICSISPAWEDRVRLHQLEAFYCTHAQFQPKYEIQRDP